MIAASIIIPCLNQLEFTRHCLRAVFRHTRPPFELIVIDNGSTDGTGVYLAGVQDSSPAPVTIIDAVVTDGWLEQVMWLAEMKTDLTTENTEGEGSTNQTNLTNQEKRIGLVGTMPNYASPPLLAGNMPYKDLAAVGGDAQAVGWAATDGYRTG